MYLNCSLGYIDIGCKRKIYMLRCYSISDICARDAQIHLLMPRWNRKAGFDGHFEKWGIESIASSLDRPFKLIWSKKMDQTQLKQTFPDYIQRHSNGQSWAPSKVGYYVLQR